jgi:hypothetical protein
MQLSRDEDGIYGRCTNCAGYGTIAAAKKTPVRPAGDRKPPKDAA